MHKQTEMVIITSNENLIRQVCLHELEKTRIVRFTQDESPNSLKGSTPSARSKAMKTSKPDDELVCLICGDRAIGFNYDALTCASCKAFFRRNAKHNPGTIRCRTGQNRCAIRHDVHRKCQRCRLNKCFAMGMKKNLILSEEEKQKRRERLEQNRQLTQHIQSMYRTTWPPKSENLFRSLSEIDQLLTETEQLCRQSSDVCDFNAGATRSKERLSREDRSSIEHIQSSYSSSLDNQSCLFHSFDASDRTSALVSWSQVADGRALKLIHFFQRIDHFERLNADDRFTLIKYNLLPLYLIQRCLYYEPITGRFLGGSSQDAFKRRQFFVLCYGSSGIRESFKSLMGSLAKATEQDSTLIHLLLVVLLFSRGLSTCENEPLLSDFAAVSRAQSHYAKLIWNYLVSKQGESQASKQWSQILTEIERVQSFAKELRRFLLNQTGSANMFERFAPIMQSVLNVV